MFHGCVATRDSIFVRKFAYSHFVLSHRTQKFHIHIAWYAAYVIIFHDVLLVNEVTPLTG